MECKCTGNDGRVIGKVAGVVFPADALFHHGAVDKLLQKGSGVSARTMCFIAVSLSGQSSLGWFG